LDGGDGENCVLRSGEIDGTHIRILLRDADTVNDGRATGSYDEE
jgi:hypothetical protein